VERVLDPVLRRHTDHVLHPRPPAVQPHLLPHVGALDGIRGLAVLGVVVFHAGVTWLPGGFLGVSTFFTLSGFLITSLLLTEELRTGTIDLPRFWAHRIRRLLPAALLAVVLAAVAVAALAGTGAQLRDFRGDGLAALGYVANWRFIAAERSYAELFDAPSPLLHFWSLAIEEQFYLLFPPLALLLAKVGRGSRRVFAGGLVALLASSSALPRLLDFGADRHYYGTDARAAELLVGALLAVALVGRPVRNLGLGRAGRLVLGVAGVTALAAMAVTWTRTDQLDAWVSAGGLALYALGSATLIAAAFDPDSPVGVLLGSWPLRALGRISYGVYLFHWPIFWLLAPPHTALSTPARLVVGTAVTLVLATLSARYVEEPIRRGRWPRRNDLPRPARLGLAPLAVATVAVAVLAVGLAERPDEREVLDAASGTLVVDERALPAGPVDASPVVPLPATTATSTTTTAPAPTGPLPAKAVRWPSRPLRLVMIGDSTALYLNVGLNGWGERQGVFGSANYARIGCGFGRGGERVNHRVPEPVPEECGWWSWDVPQYLRRTLPDVVVVASGLWDATDRRLDGDGTWRAPGDPVYDTFLLEEYARVADAAHATGAVVVWLDNPPVALGADHLPPATDDFAVNDPARMARLDALVAEVAATRPWMRVVALSDWFEAWPGGVFDPTLRPDGVHVDEAGGTVVAEWLGPEILDAYWQVTTTG
jgi:peptidoglycan/LPS O-acetylase OafA/YrhL/lysophospholipase L1-like esterase